MYLNRKLASQLGHETLEILEQGFYLLSDETRVDLQPQLDFALEDTEEFPPERSVSLPSVGEHATTFEVFNDTSLRAAQRLVEQGLQVGVLNFASAKNPGGGFLSGARAQEESLARSSGLYTCLKDKKMYAHHRSMRSCLYSDYVIVSSGVPVFRNDAGDLLPEPYLCTFLTSPAVNAGVVRKRKEAKWPEIEAVMRERIKKVLSLAAHYRCEALVLGAWGCGVFQNPSEMIAGLFSELLLGDFVGVFKHITFAVLDSSKQQKFIGPFLQQFGHCRAQHE